MILEGLSILLVPDKLWKSRTGELNPLCSRGRETGINLQKSGMGGTLWIAAA